MPVLRPASEKPRPNTWINGEGYPSPRSSSNSTSPKQTLCDNVRKIMIGETKLNKPAMLKRYREGKLAANFFHERNRHKPVNKQETIPEDENKAVSVRESPSKQTTEQFEEIRGKKRG
jgi:hypothetical protein